MDKKYQDIIDDIREIYLKSGSDLYYKSSDWDLNPYQKSKDGIEITLDYGSVCSMQTPDGGHPVLGSRSCGDDDLAMKMIHDKYQFAIVRPQLPDEKCHYCASGPTYRIM
jgi:hypothetical protein